jgi:hypothetical protein
VVKNSNKPKQGKLMPSGTDRRNKIDEIHNNIRAAAK